MPVVIHKGLLNLIIYLKWGLKSIAQGAGIHIKKTLCAYKLSFMLMKKAGMALSSDVPSPGIDQR